MATAWFWTEVSSENLGACECWKPFLFDLSLIQPKPVRLSPKLISWSFRVFGSFAVMAEGGKVSVDDGKSTDGRIENNLITVNFLFWKISHDHHFQFGAWLTKHIIWLLIFDWFTSPGKSVLLHLLFCFPQVSVVLPLTPASIRVQHLKFLLILSIRSIYICPLNLLIRV